MPAPVLARRPVYPSRAEAAMARILRARARALRELVRVGLLAALQRVAASRTDTRADGIAEDETLLRAAVRALRANWERDRTFGTADLAPVAQQLDMFTTAQVARGLTGVVSVDVFTPARTAAAREAFARENAALVKSIESSYFEDLGATIAEAVRTGRSTDEVAAAIAERGGVLESKARLLARDQIGKLNAKITEERHAQVGITEYVWSTSRDERVRGRPGGLYPKARPSHWAREGLVFRYDSPPQEDPYDGAPGHPPLCRCVAIPRLPGEPLGRARRYRAR